VLDQVQRIPGVGAAVQFGSEYAMRIWLDADKLRPIACRQPACSPRYGRRTPSSPPRHWRTARRAGSGHDRDRHGGGTLPLPEQFENILLRTDPNGASVRAQGCGARHAGAAQYGFETNIGTTPVAAFGIQLAPNANALEVSEP